MKILIVEDEEALAKGLKFNFEQEGFQVTVATDGPTGLDLFRQADPGFDLVILDLMLPGMSGYETCRNIRQTNQQIPVLVLSARTLSQDKALAETFQLRGHRLKSDDSYAFAGHFVLQISTNFNKSLLKSQKSHFSSSRD